jgi:hypothetical protein
MEKSASWEADSHSASTDIPRHMWNPRVHYRFHNSPPLVSILNQMNPVHNSPSYFPKIHFSIISPSTSRSYEWLLTFRFSDENFVCISLEVSLRNIKCMLVYYHLWTGQNPNLKMPKKSFQNVPKFRDSWMAIASKNFMGYGLDDRGSRVRFLAGAGNFSLHHRVQNGSGAHPASYPRGKLGSFPGGKAAGREADHSPPSSVEVKECVEIYLHSPNTP